MNGRGLLAWEYVEAQCRWPEGDAVPCMHDAFTIEGL
jgi:hypothetical protein